MSPPNEPGPIAKKLPSLQRRLASMAYECLLLLGVLSVTFMLPHLLLGMGGRIVLPGWILFSHIFLVLGVYFIWYWHHGGQTLAMQTWQLQLVSTHNTKPSFSRLVLRYMLAWPSLLYFFSGLIWALFDRHRQFLHDRLAGTQIVFKTQTPSAAQPTITSHPPQKETAYSG